MIDFEASCLPRYGRSYPIEVALCGADGQLRFEALIQPDPNWLDWDWDPAAERLHGVSLDQLQALGRPCRDVMHDLNKTMGKLQAVSDSNLDAVWLQTLSDVAGVRPTFDLVGLQDVLQAWTSGPADDDLVKVASERAYAKFSQIHRAAPDAQRLAETLRLIADATGRS